MSLSAPALSFPLFRFFDRTGDPWTVSLVSESEDVRFAPSGSDLKTALFKSSTMFFNICENLYSTKVEAIALREIRCKSCCKRIYERGCTRYVVVLSLLSSHLSTHSSFGAGRVINSILFELDSGEVVSERSSFKICAAAASCRSLSSVLFSSFNSASCDGPAI